MKIILFVLCFLCALGAAGQNVSTSMLNNEIQVIQMAGHPGHASQHGLAEEQNILEHSDYIHAQGLRPLWDVVPTSYPMPLGDAARILRKEHATAKKADIIWVN